MRFAEKLTSLRKSLEVSQETIAERLSVSRQAVAKWESGETLPDVDNLVALSRYFAVTLDALLKDEEDCRAARPQSLPAASDVLGFLCRAKRVTYAGKGAEVEPSRTASRDLRYQEGEWEYYDSYLGSERFAGEEALWHAGTPFWAMNYVGRVLDESFSGDFLKAALAHVETDLPYRGPALYQEQDKTYHCEVDGTFDWFTGFETIYHSDRKVYECRFHGGAVN